MGERIGRSPASGSLVRPADCSFGFFFFLSHEKTQNETKSGLFFRSLVPSRTRRHPRAPSPDPGPKRFNDLARGICARPSSWRPWMGGGRRRRHKSERLHRSPPSASLTQPQHGAHAEREACGNSPPYGSKGQCGSLRDQIIRERFLDDVDRAFLGMLAGQEYTSREPDPLHAETFPRFHSLRPESRRLASRSNELSPT